ncbi:MAG: DUF2085 domain-containing protein [Deltaproteobacteria bacterium]|nr:DUF2085 domain-containing protein [Deltaproteobacteria bacterium]
MKLGWGARRFAICARCLAVYPLLVISLTLLLWTRVGPLGWVDHVWVLIGSTPALLDWGASRLGAPGNNRWRMLTGGLLGVALGRSFSLYVNEVYSEVFWIHALMVLITMSAFEVVRSLDLGDF